MFALAEPVWFIFVAIAAFALNSCQLAIEHDSPAGRWPAMVSNAEALLQSGQIEEALIAWRKTLVLASAFGGQGWILKKSLYCLAQLEFNAGNFKQAEELFKQLVSMGERHCHSESPGSAWLLEELGDACFWQGKYADAEKAYKRSEFIYESHRRILPMACVSRKLGELYARLDDWKQALQNYNKAEGFACVVRDDPFMAPLKYIAQEEMCQLSEDRAELAKRTKHDRLAFRYSLVAAGRWQNLNVHLSKNLSGECTPASAADVFQSYTRKPDEQGSLQEAVAPDLARLIEHLACYYCRLGMYADAESLFEHSVEVFNRVSELNPALSAHRREFLMNLYKSWSACRKEEPLYLQVESKLADERASRQLPAFDNPYLREFARLTCKYDYWQNYLSMCQQYAPSIPTLTCLETIKSYGPIVIAETGAGYWTTLLRRLGANVVALSATASDQKLDQPVRAPLPVWNTSGQPASKFMNFKRTLLICCPPLNNDFAYQVLSHYKGHYVIYIGEEREGLNANRAFFDLLASRWQLKSMKSIPQWPDAYDAMWIYERKPSEKSVNDSRQ